MKKIFSLMLFMFVVFGFLGCVELTTTDLTSTVSSSTQTSVTTSTQMTTSTQTTTQTEVQELFSLSGLSGDGSLDNPFVMNVVVNEYSTVAIEKNASVDLITMSEVIFDGENYVSLPPESLHGVDVSNSTIHSFVVRGNLLGTFYVQITVDSTDSYLVRINISRKPLNIDFTKDLKVLAIGNSFSVDAMEYLYKIASNYGIENITLGILYIGGASLQTHVTSFNSASSNYTYYKNTADSWTSLANKTLLYGLLDEEWDIITIQQVSGQSGLPLSYDPYLDSLIQIVTENKTNDDARIFWHMTWAYQQDSTHSDFQYYNQNQATMYESITSTVLSKIDPRLDIDRVIPSGTAIQNLRTSYIGDHLTRDGYHLSLSLGRYTAALTWFLSITSLPISGITYKPAGVSDADLEAIKEAVINSTMHPYEITTSSFPYTPY